MALHSTVVEPMDLLYTTRRSKGFEFELKFEFVAE